MKNTLHLGITMAGAVSAGAYTAGVIDYLFEALQKWQEIKDKEAHLPPEQWTVPHHDVRIEVIGGASAGGITAALTALSLFTGSEPVIAPESAKNIKNNLLFDAWIKLGGGKEAIVKMLGYSDLKAGAFSSLLNSSPIDEIADEALRHVKKHPRATWPAFVAEDLEILLTLCSLHGISAGIDFNSGNNTWKTVPSHQMSTHKQYARFTTGKYLPAERAMPLEALDEDSLKPLIECAKATSAFPGGFIPRQISLPRNHVKHQFKHFLKLNDATLKAIFETGSVTDPFVFTSVDGGALNNEPFDEIAVIMEERGFKKDDFAMILIDPFPNFDGEKEAFKAYHSVVESAIPLIGAFRNQGMFKESDLSKLGGKHTEYHKNMIYPTRKALKPHGWEPQKSPIACGSLGGFSGFLSKEFRLHDYFLGRMNCRNFLHSYFTIEYREDTTHAIFEHWTPALREQYRVKWRTNGVHLPIIPTLDFLEKEKEIYEQYNDPAIREEKLLEFGRKTPMPFPSLSKSGLRKLHQPLFLRLCWTAHALTSEITFILRWPLRAVLLLLMPLIFLLLRDKILGSIRSGLQQSGLMPPPKHATGVWHFLSGIPRKAIYLGYLLFALVCGCLLCAAGAILGQKLWDYLW